MQDTSTLPDPGAALLRCLGETVRGLRREAGLSRVELAARSGVSARFLAQLESGGNVSVGTLAQIAEALRLPPWALLREASERSASLAAQRERTRRVALIGLRGAGKSTVGQRLAARLGHGFVELDERVEAAAGLSLGEIFSLQGEGYFRSLEREALVRVLGEAPGQVIATGGGLVGAAETYDLLRRACFTVWLRAQPDEHWDRVTAQGDRRPMRAFEEAEARRQLSQLLRDREPLYQRADLTIDTSKLGVDDAVAAIVAALDPAGPAGQ